MHIAYFVTPHGFGHAARACAVMEAVLKQNPQVHFEIFTQVPAWFFEDSLAGGFTVHPLLSDIGLVQLGPLQEDLPATLQRLNHFYPPNPAHLQSLSLTLHSLGCRLVLCDIAPLGILVARAAGLPSVLLENFTWDWIYTGYLPDLPALQQVIDYLQTVFQQADHHIQMTPFCAPSLRANLITQPVGRQPRQTSAQLRQRLGIPEFSKMVLVTMGGIPDKFNFSEKLASYPEIYFVNPGDNPRLERRDNIILIPHHSGFYHPDLMNACDGVIGKAGYSTIAETYNAGVPFAYAARPRFRETRVLGDFANQYSRGFEVPEQDFASGGWIERLLPLLHLPRLLRTGPDGAQQIAEYLQKLL
jgi:hypothetical protein